MTRPNMSFVVNKLSQLLTALNQLQWQGVQEGVEIYKRNTKLWFSV